MLNRVDFSSVVKGIPGGAVVKKTTVGLAVRGGGLGWGRWLGDSCTAVPGTVTDGQKECWSGNGEEGRHSRLFGTKMGREQG